MPGPKNNVNVLLIKTILIKDRLQCIVDCNTMRLLVFIVVALVAHATTARIWRHRRNAKSEYKMCVPEDLLELCKQMTIEETKSTAKIVCVPARDRVECIDKIKAREADFFTVDPEDMYIASKVPEEDFTIFEEIRTKEEPEAEFRYEAVAVIHKDLQIDDIHQGLRGLNSCHTGVGRNVGYKIPLTKLKSMGIIGNLAEPDLSPRENELKALSTLFSKACIVGKWSPDPKINSAWKEKYSNLCALCEHPDLCDYPDNFSGYDGALRCLAHNGGQIAWTKVIFVRKFFGLPVGITSASSSNENPEDYAYLCPDGSKVPVTGPPCRWAARPWQGFMTNADVVKKVDELRRKIENLNIVGAKNHAPWLFKVLELTDKTAPKENKFISPGDYLDKANYTDVIERDYGPPFKTVRFCVTSEMELRKCRAFSSSAFSRNIRPRFDCIEEKNVYDCLKSVRDKAADIITLDYNLASSGAKFYNLKPIVAEQYGSVPVLSYAVAVVKKDSNYRSLADLKGAKSCHADIEEVNSYQVPLYNLMKQHLIDDTKCDYPKALANFFSGSCLPGAKLDRLKLEESLTSKLCSICAGDSTSKCTQDSSEKYHGYSGAFRCLSEGAGDVAFLLHDTVKSYTDGANQESWAANLKSSDYELLCPNGGRVSIDNYVECNLAQEPAHMVVTSKEKTDSDVDEIRNALISASSLYLKRPDYFKMFGTFDGKKDLLFKDAATSLVSVSDELSESQKNYLEILNMVIACPVH